VTAGILAVDVGTSCLKVGVFGAELDQRAGAQRTYTPHLYAQGWADVDPEAWWQALRDSCHEIRGDLRHVEVLALSVTTPGLTPMDASGAALAPAVLFLDGRSRRQAEEIRRLVGEERFLAETCNLPVSGGSSLASILWFRDERPDVWKAARIFGHTNTYLVRRLTGRWAIDPSTTSITGLYSTASDDLSWNRRVLELAGIDPARLPPLLRSHEAVGPVLERVAGELGLPRGTVVLCGGNDAVLAALSGGLANPGDINIISGTCDIASVCTDHPVSSTDFNVRCHVVPGRWLTFFVLNAGGEGLAWFRRVACSEMTEDEFYGSYVPAVIARFLSDPDLPAREAGLPGYVPFLGGSRYSLERLTGSFGGLTLETTRDGLLLALLRGGFNYLGTHLREVARHVVLNQTIGISGGAAGIPGMLELRRRWTGNFNYVFQDQSSLRGAAMLGRFFQAGWAAPPGAAGDMSTEASHGIDTH
jgi:xylulokinase